MGLDDSVREHTGAGDALRQGSTLLTDMHGGIITGRAIRGGETS